MSVDANYSLTQYVLPPPQLNVGSVFCFYVGPYEHSADSLLPTLFYEPLQCGYCSVSSTASPYPCCLHGQELWRMEEG